MAAGSAGQLVEKNVAKLEVKRPEDDLTEQKMEIQFSVVDGDKKNAGQLGDAADRPPA